MKFPCPTGVRRGASVAVLLAAVAGCEAPPPQGQVIASVGGEDVTRRDLAAEMAASGLPPDAEAAARDTLVRRIVDRRLLVREAERQGLDRTPDYLATLRRQRETLAAAALADRLAADVPMPRPADVAARIARDPWRFAERRIVLVDGIAGDLPPGAAERLATLASLDAVAARLRAAGRPFVRRGGTLDTATLSGDAAARLGGSAIGTPVLLGMEGGPAIVAVTARIAAPVDAAQARRIATATLRRERAAALIERQLAAARARTTIRYQIGFGPSAENSRVRNWRNE